MKVRAEEIASILKKEVADYQTDVHVDEVGTVIEVGDGIAQIYGLANCMAGEMLEFENGAAGLAFNLDESTVGAVILGDYLDLKEGAEVKRTGKVVSVPVGQALVGRVVDALGNPLDDKGPINAEAMRPIEMPAPGIAGRQPVDTSLATGIKAIDAMIPIGRGQRELIIGDRGTGKTAIAIDTIINQKGTGVICVYVAVGQKSSTVAGVVQKLREAGAMDYTIVVNAPASDPAPMQYVAPYTGCTMAEHFMYAGKDTLCVYDDLSKQATAYRQLSLLLRRPPGREAYPGDIFYCHSRLLERAARLSEELGGGSLTALPVIETQEGEVSAYIPTNVISITDGQIYLVPDLFFAGVRPAIDVGISVSRVGSAAQRNYTKTVSGGLKLALANYRELEAFASLGTELDKTTQSAIDRGVRMVELLKQGQYGPMSALDQCVAVFAGTQGHLDRIPVARVQEFEAALLAHVHETHAEIFTAIEALEPLRGDEFKAAYKTFAATLGGVVKGFVGQFLGEGMADVRTGGSAA
jgi:F-type H+/Na+-transporting ATPase subunit alpha